jgi:hypothetical protein
VELTNIEVVPVRNKILSNALVAIMTITLLLGASSAHAAKVIQDPAGNATGIQDLELNGLFYDVEFLYGRGNDVFGGPLDLDFIDPDPALAAAEAVAEVLAAESTPVTTVGLSQTDDSYNIPFGITGNNARVVRGTSDGGGGWTTAEVGGTIEWFLDDYLYAQFSESAGAPAPEISFSANPANIEFGGTSTLIWLVTDADSCTGSLGSGDWPGAKDPVFDSEVHSPMVTSPYLLTCLGPGGESESEVTVTVPEPGAILSMAAALATLGVVRRWRRKESEGTA